MAFCGGSPSRLIWIWYGEEGEKCVWNWVMAGGWKSCEVCARESLDCRKGTADGSVDVEGVISDGHEERAIRSRKKGKELG